MFCSVRAQWTSCTPEAGAVLPVESSTEFYRVASALFFIFAMPAPEGKPNENNFVSRFLITFTSD